VQEEKPEAQSGHGDEDAVDQKEDSQAFLTGRFRLQLLLRRGL